MSAEPTKPPAVSDESTPSRAGRPRHFHLLWDEDLEEMQDLFKAIRDRRAEVVANWYQLYSLHFGDARVLSEAEFSRIFEPALFRNKNDLLERNMDRYAADVMGEARSLIGALRKLNEKNLSNLTPHPLYSGFYYSHPTLLEREQALASVLPAGPPTAG